METNQFIIFILLMVLATQVSRLAPLFLLSKTNRSPRFEQWLKHIPIAILTALITPEFFEKNPSHWVDLNLVFCIAGAAALLVGLKTKNLILTTVAGVATAAIARQLLTLLS